jgi:hypothetical protein
MNKIPPPLKKDILADPDYGFCMKHGHVGHLCDGRITWEHTITFAGKQLQAKFAILALCERGHSVLSHMEDGDLNKEVNEWIMLNRATDAEIAGISKAINYTHRKKYLNDKYGVWEMQYPAGARGEKLYRTTVKVSNRLLKNKGLLTAENSRG